MLQQQRERRRNCYRNCYSQRKIAPAPQWCTVDIVLLVGIGCSNEEDKVRNRETRGAQEVIPSPGLANRVVLLIENKLFGVDQSPEDVLVGDFLASGSGFGFHRADVFQRGRQIVGGGFAGERPQE